MNPFSTGIVTSIIVLLVSSPVAAQRRPMTPEMFCAEIQQLVQRRGAVVMNTSPTTYDRIVRDQSACLNTETTEALHVPAYDTQYCFAGYICRDRHYNRRR